MLDPLETRMMERALELAGRAAGKTSPNPLVGAVVVSGGLVVGEGYHHQAGKPHAEVLALRQAGCRARGATIVVSLEPCAHYGRTAPCTAAIIKAGVKRVVLAMRDPNPLVRGRGINALRRAGIEVRVGLLREKARRLNEVFIQHAVTGLPFAALKLAQSLDGAIAAKPGERTAITARPALHFSHRLRSLYDAVLVGVSTVLVDDPMLTVRGIRGARQPVRVVLDCALRIPPDCRLVSSAGNFPLLVLYDSALAPEERVMLLQGRGVRLEAVKGGGSGRLDPREVLTCLAGQGITSVLVEGGRQVATSFLRERAFQRLHLFIAPLLLGEGGPLHAWGEFSPDPLKLRQVEKKILAPDLYLTGRITYPRG